ncbi:Uncharacterized protein QTN25_001190 [Entamoeba marina]
MLGQGFISVYNQIQTDHLVSGYNVAPLSIICGLIAIIISLLVLYLYQVHTTSAFVFSFIMLFSAATVLVTVTFISFIDAYSVKSLVKQNTSQLISLEYDFDCCGYKSQQEHCKHLHKSTCYTKIVKPFYTFRLLMMVTTSFEIIQTIMIGVFLCLWFDGLDTQLQDSYTLHITRND